ncbi:META domain-containing protein [Rathayibacter festucae]|uniref:META domain-containing protein n=1 Tax=Rathayibacter festucae TaxID=110937 RepID=UPI002A6A55D4|nr:META domain-containing protein [Rathayibacter festucae]MDY0912325.1 META domain-containing protein [Rathayibacter festucae]
MSQRRRLAVLLLAPAVALGLSACTAEENRPLPTATPVQELDVGTYRSTSLTSTSEFEFTDPDDSLTMWIDDESGDRIAIDNPCNTLGSSFVLADGVLTPGDVSTTLAACAPPGDAIDRWVGSILSEPLTVTRSGSELTFTNDWGQMVFAPER